MFSFQELPILIKWKILREYVSVFTKARHLHGIPDFSDALKYRECWLNNSPEFQDLYDCLQTIRPGAYLSKTNWWTDGYLVVMTDEKISFKRFKINIIRSHYLTQDWQKLQIFPALDKVEFETDPSEMVTFLRKFFQEYEPWDKDVVNYYAWEGIYNFGRDGVKCRVTPVRRGQYFAVNRKLKKLRLFNGQIVNLKCNACFVKIRRWMYLKINLGEDAGVVYMEPHGYGFRHYLSTSTSRRLEYRPLPLETYIEKLDNDFTFDFKLKNDRSVLVEFTQETVDYFRRDNFFYDIPSFNKLWRERKWMNFTHVTLRR